MKATVSELSRHATELEKQNRAKQLEIDRLKKQQEVRPYIFYVKSIPDCANLANVVRILCTYRNEREVFHGTITQQNCKSKFRSAHCHFAQTQQTTI